MCNDFSAIVTRNGACYWRRGLSSHSEIVEAFRDQDAQLRDVSEMEHGPYAKIEIVPIPRNSSYLDAEREKWGFELDEPEPPTWWTGEHESAAWSAWRAWIAEVHALINLDEARNPVDPRKINPPEITDEVLTLLRQWASVGASVGARVRDSVGDSVWDSVGDSVWDSVGDSVWACVGARVWARVRASVWASVGDSVWACVGARVWARVRASVWARVRDSVWACVGAYIGSLFRIWTDDYPYESGALLWRMGLVPSYDGKTWRLHGGPDMAVLWKGTF